MMKLGNAMAMLEKVLPLAEPKVVPNSEEIISEIFGVTGYKDGKRFFHFPDPNQPEPDQPDPMIAIEQLKAEMQREIASIRAEADVQRANIAADAAIQAAELKNQGAVTMTQMQLDEDRAAHIRELLHGALGSAADRDASASEGEAERAMQMQQGAAQRMHAAGQSAADRMHAADQGEADRAAQAEQAATAAEAEPAQ
jgi:hypothetical protein